MGIQYEFSTKERDCIIAALELLNESNGIQAFPKHDAFKLLDVMRSRGPQTAPGTPHAASVKACMYCNEDAVEGPYGPDYCTPDGCPQRDGREKD